MTISSSDIVIYKTQRMQDTDDGGGFPTSVTVTDNLSGDVFPGISELDSMGRTKVRKLAMGIDTETAETYYGAGIYVSSPPTNSAVDVVLTEATSYEDEAADIKNAVEAYLSKSVLTPLVLWGPHPIGLTTLYAYQRTVDRLPQPGEVYCIDDGTEAHDHYFRIVSVDHETMEFEDAAGVFYREVVTLTMNNSLEIAFEGEDLPVRYTISPDVKIRNTVPVQAIDFHSISPISAEVAEGSQTLTIDSVYSHIVPSSEQELPLVDHLAGAERSVLAATAPAAIPIVSNASGTHIYLPCAMKPGSVYVTGSSYFTDNGDGTLSGAAGTATINYDVADIIFPSSGIWSISGVPAANIIGPAHTMEIQITTQNRGFTYIRTLTPIPSPGQCFVDYRVDDLWYRMEDDGSGTLQGVGVGQINFTTGSLRVTLPAYPDVGSSIIITWGTDIHLESRAGDATITLPTISGTLAETAIDFSTVEVTWLSGGVEKTATANAAGVFSGDGTGYVKNDLEDDGTPVCVYDVIPSASAVPDPGSAYEVAYENRATFSEVFSNVSESDPGEYEFTIDAGSLPLDPEKTEILVSVELGWPSRAVTLVIIRSDASGNLTSEFYHDRIEGSALLDPSSNINPTTGDVFIKFAQSIELPYFWAGAWASNFAQVPTGNAYDFTVVGEKVDTFSATSDEAIVDTLRLDLTPLDTKIVAPDGILIDIGGTRIYTRSGIAYKDFDPTTGSGTAIGTINYSTGVLLLTDWSGLTFSSIVVRSLAVIRGDWGIDYVYGRTPVAPLRHESFEITATELDGTNWTALADGNGVVRDSEEEAIDGTINDDTGVFSLRFGELVEDATLTALDKQEPWYDAGNVENGYIFRPRLMFPNLLRVNAVGLFYLPADEEDVGIDSTRLPQDGRVRSSKKGDKLIIHHTDDDEMPNGLIAGQQVQLSRGELAICRLFDTEGDLVPTTKYAMNLATGLITMANPLDLTGYPQPLTARHTIRDSAKAVDSQINGVITLSRPVSHTYPVGSYVSSLLVAGDRFARVENLRTIETWIDFEHADGDPAIGQYNDVDYPITVTDAGCEEDDWCLHFESGTTFVAIGRRRGQLQGTGSVNSDFAPINPLTNLPFFTVYASGWSAGFQSGNALRFLTRSAKFPFWTFQCIQPTTPPQTGDTFEWSTFGNVV